MSSIKVKFRPSTVEVKEGTIYYQVIHDRRIRQIPTNYHIYKYEWDEKKSTVVVNYGSTRRGVLLSIRERIKWDVERIYKIIRKLDTSGMAYDVDEIVGEFNRYAVEYSLFNYMESVIARLKQNGKEGTAENYKSTLNNFKKFRSGEDIMLDNITPKLIEDYEAWLKNSAVSPNTISFYMRTLRAVYNRAVEEDITANNNPFKRVYTGVDKTVKRAVPIEVIRRLMLLDLSMQPKLDFARDMFLLSFYLRGMSFIDMAFLRKSDLRDTAISYRRRKTGQKLTIAWERDMQYILDKYETPATEYLLPVIKDVDTNPRSVYKNVLRSINQNLKKLSKLIGVSVPITMYVARHSWASAARMKGIPLTVISEGMGHDSEATTKIYLASLETSVVDEANSLIISSLK